MDDWRSGGGECFDFGYRNMVHFASQDSFDWKAVFSALYECLLGQWNRRREIAWSYYLDSSRVQVEYQHKASTLTLTQRQQITGYRKKLNLCSKVQVDAHTFLDELIDVLEKTLTLCQLFRQLDLYWEREDVRSHNRGVYFKAGADPVPKPWIAHMQEMLVRLKKIQ